MKQNKTIIGITGGIATGKSTVTKILKDKGFEVIDADLISKRVLQIGQDAYEEVVESFGIDILNSDNSIDRKKLGIKIFKDSVEREKLNAITHPYIIKEIKNQIKKSKEEIIFLDIPLLIEIYDELTSNEIYINEIWLVYCNREIQIKRLMKRDYIDRELAEAKVSSQIDIEEKKKLVDKIISNQSNELELIKNLEQALKEIL